MKTSKLDTSAPPLSLDQAIRERNAWAAIDLDVLDENMAAVRRAMDLVSN